MSLSVNNLGISQKTLIYITADHGFDEGSVQHFNSPYIFFATNDRNVSRNGDEVDVAPTIYYGLGLWNQTFNPLLDGYPLQIGLQEAEVQHRNSVLSDTSNLASPTLSLTDSGADQKTVTISAQDNNLAAVYLFLDNTMIADYPITRGGNGIPTASGSYNLATANLSTGQHTLKVLAFDEHGANNGGPGNDPINGGGPSTNSVSFYAGPQPSPTTTLPNPSTSPSIVPSPSPYRHGTNSTPTPTPTHIPTQEPSAPPQNNSSNRVDSTALLVPVAAIIVAAACIYLIVAQKKKKQ
jgi:hypothetical protein